MYSSTVKATDVSGWRILWQLSLNHQQPTGCDFNSGDHSCEISATEISVTLTV